MAALTTHCFDDVVGSESDVLHTRSSIVLDILLNLTDPLARSWLIDWHLDGPLPISDHHRTEAAVLCVDLMGREKREQRERRERREQREQRERRVKGGGGSSMRTERYSGVLTILSSTDQKRWNCSVFLYQSATGSIRRSGWFPTT